MDDEVRKWIDRRVSAIKAVYGTYDCLTENGVELVDENTDLQISCPFHKDRRPSARYYATASGSPHFHCFTCKLHLDSINLYMKFRGVEFMQALSELERRFGISVPRRPESPELQPDEPEPDRWADVPRMLGLLERKLLRLRDRTSMIDFVKFCRVLDAVGYDLERNGNNPTPSMAIALNRLREMMDSVEDPP